MALMMFLKLAGPWCKRLKSDGYCGFMCGPVVEDVQNVLDEIKLLSKYNPEFAIEFLDKLTKMLG